MSRSFDIDIGTTGIDEIDQRNEWCVLCQCPLSLTDGSQRFFLMYEYVRACNGCLSRIDARRTAVAIVKAAKWIRRAKRERERIPEHERSSLRYSRNEIRKQIVEFQQSHCG